MKLTAIALRDHVSHADTAVEFGDARLVSLVGQNGAGKSSLIESLLYVLFDGARGRTDQLVRLGATEMSAQVTFEHAGNTYRVTRGRTTRGAGKSYLELQVRDGEAWRPLTGDDIRSTQAAIEQLLHLDADTFTSAAFLRQGDADRFVSATAAERKRVLGSALGLDVYERAEARARELARDQERDSEAERDRLTALEERLADGQQHRDAVAHWTSELAGFNEVLATAQRGRDEAEAALRDLAGKVASADAAIAEVARLEQDLEDQRGRWQRARETKDAAERAIIRAMTALERAPEVEAAAARLPQLRLELADLDARERQHVGMTDELRRHQDDQAKAEQAHREAVAAHGSRVAVAQREVETLTAATAALADETCPKCGKAFTCRSDMPTRDALLVATERLAAVGDAPRAPIAIDRHRALVVGTELRIRELAHDPEALATARRDLVATERLAAEASAVTAARQALEDGRRSLAAAKAELEAVRVAGDTAVAALTVASERAQGAQVLRAGQVAHQRVLDVAREALVAAEKERASAQVSLARAEAAVAELERLAVERDEVAAGLERQMLELARMRRLVTAFGVNGIPARIIEGTLPELAVHANELLERLRPGMSLELRAQRAKRSGDGVIEALDLMVRDEVGERPLALWSGGERTSVALAIAVALTRLVARRAGARITTLVVDEPEGLDAQSRRAFGEAMRSLTHQGELELIVLVSHHDDLADYADAVYRVEKRDGRSVVLDADGTPQQAGDAVRAVAA